MKKVVDIPKAPEKDIVVLPSGTLGNIKERFEKIDQILFGILVSVVLSMIAIIVAVVGLFLDQMRFNNAAYKDYSEKLDTVKSLQETNKLLLETNQKNQDAITTLTVQVQQFLTKSQNSRDTLNPIGNQ